MNSYEIVEYKRKIMKALIDSDRIVQLVDYANKAEYPDDLLYENIFPYNRVPDTEQEESVYICVMVDIPTSYAKNDVARNVTIRFRVYAHERLMKVKGESGDRIDLLAAAIDELFNERLDFGFGPLGIGSCTEHVYDSRHHYREIIFKTIALNSKRSGVTQWDQ